MKTNNMEELTERYIYAVTRYLKKSEREDIAKELHSIIDDMVAEQYGDQEINEYQMKALLMELGTPAQLYEKYSSSGKDSLIGPPYYGMYKTVLKIVLGCVIFGMIISQAISLTFDPVSPLTAAANILASLISTLLGAFSFVTILFAILYHKNIKMAPFEDSLDHLPELPKKKDRISPVSCILEIAFTAAFTTIFLICPQIFFMLDTNTGAFTPLFNVAYIHQTWYLILLFAVLGMSRDIMKLIEGRHTSRLLLVSAVTDALSAVLVILWLKNDAVMNPAFCDNMKMLFTGDAAFIYTAMTHFNLFFMGTILFALALDFAAELVDTNR